MNASAWTTAGRGQCRLSRLAVEGDEASRQKMLEFGADQFLTRPFSPETLMTSIGAIWHDPNRAPALGARELLTFSISNWMSAVIACGETAARFTSLQPSFACCTIS